MLRLSSCAPTPSVSRFCVCGKVDGKSRRLLLFSSSCAATRRLPHKKLTGAPSDFRKVDRGSRPGWSACKSTQMRRRTQHSFCSVSPLETQTRRYLAVAFLRAPDQFGSRNLQGVAGHGWLGRQDATAGASWYRLRPAFLLRRLGRSLTDLALRNLLPGFVGLVGFGRLSQATESRPSDLRKVDGGTPPTLPCH